MSDQAADSLAYQGYRALMKDRNQDAVNLFEQALAKEPQKAEWWYDLGIAYQRMSRHADAILACQRACELAPNSDDFRRKLVEMKCYIAYEAQIAEQYEEAVRLYREGLNVDERDAKSWFNLGLAYLKLGRGSDAKDAFEHAVAIEPDNPTYRVAPMVQPKPKTQP